jgi:hypothetical protein
MTSAYTAQAPAGAVAVQAFLMVENTLAGEVHLLDRAGLVIGTATEQWADPAAPPGHLSSTRVLRRHRRALGRHPRRHQLAAGRDLATPAETVRIPGPHRGPGDARRRAEPAACGSRGPRGRSHMPLWEGSSSPVKLGEGGPVGTSPELVVHRLQEDLLRLR